MSAETIKQRLLEVYVRDALATKGGCNESYKLTSFSSLLASLTPEDFSGVVLPVLEKLQKKNPDSILVAVASLVKLISIDLSAYVGVFLPPLLRQLRSAKEQVRHLAVELTGNLAERCGDMEVRVPLVRLTCVFSPPCLKLRPTLVELLPARLLARCSSRWFLS